MAQYPVTPKGGRLPNRLGEQASAENQPAAPSVDLNEMFGAGDQQEAPAAEPVTETVQDEPTKEPPKAPKPPKEEKKPKSPLGKKSKKAEEEDTAGKEKYSFYLTPKLSLALRMVYIATRKRYSQIAETALSDMLFNRYQCENPGCTARFSISERGDTPTCCPVCGGKKFEPLRLDILD